MLQLDHLVVVAPNLKVGGEHVEQCLGVSMDPGGEHPQMGTHNLLLKLGDAVFLEVIAINPNAEPPEHPRWFGLDDTERVQADWDAGRRLRTWVAQTASLDALLDTHGELLGNKTHVSRGDREWHFSLRRDGYPPLDGAVPAAIDWGSRGNPAAGMPERDLRLEAFTVHTPHTPAVEQTFSDLHIQAPPDVQHSAQVFLHAQIRTPLGLKTLR